MPDEMIYFVIVLATAVAIAGNFVVAALFRSKKTDNCE